MFNLKDKIIIVTGGSGLLGQTFINAIKEQDGIAINADITSDKNLEKGTYKLDITSSDSIDELLEAVLQRYGTIDGWVNNAYPRTKDWGLKFEDIPLASWQQNVDMHLNGYFLCCQKALEKMKLQKDGSLINIASIYGVVGPDFTIYEGTEMTMPAAYAAIKGGLVNLTRYLAAYYGPSSVRANCLSPGGIWDNQPDSFVEAYSKKVPLKRMGTPEDIAPSIVYLLSDEAKYVTGHNLIVDGGWSII